VTTRAEFFAKIRGELQKKPALFTASTSTRPEHPAAQADTIRRELAERWPATLEKFREEFERVAGVFHRVASLEDVAPAIEGIARERGARELVSWHAGSLAGDGLSRALTARGIGVHEMPAGEAADGAEHARLRAVTARADLGLTGVDLAVAETGTLVLVSGAGRPRSTSLLPPCHIGDAARHGRRGELHHRAEPDRRHRAHADARGPRAQGSARDLRGRGSPWLSGTSRRPTWRR
jgi:L-lactate utilization protein LutB